MVEERLKRAIDGAIATQFLLLIAMAFWWMWSVLTIDAIVAKAESIGGLWVHVPSVLVGGCLVGFMATFVALEVFIRRKRRELKVVQHA